MAVDQYGTKNEPIFLSTGAPEVDVDPTAVAAYAAKVGNRRVGTTAERLAASGKDVWDGLEWFDTTNRMTYIYQSGWVLVPKEIGSAYRTTATAVVATAYADLADMSITATFTGGKVRLTFLAMWINPTSNNDRSVNLRARLDGVDINPVPTPTMIPFINGTSTGTPTLYIWEFTPSAGSHTITMQAFVSVANSVSIGVASHMKVEEVG